MTQGAAPMSPAIKIVTGLVLGMLVGLLLFAVNSRPMLVGVALLAAVIFFCYLQAPVAYELEGDQLTVRLRSGQKVFPGVTGCSTLTARPPRGLRLFGNGGLFGVTGIFWNKPYGVFRAYLTSARYQDYVLVDTINKKVLISPENPAAFVRAWAALAPGSPASG